jgi:hypothetical protein
MDRPDNFLKFVAGRCRDRVLDLVDWFEFGPDPSAWWLLALPLVVGAGFWVVTKPIAMLLCAFSLVGAVLLFIGLALVLLAIKTLIGIGDAIGAVMSEPTDRRAERLGEVMRGQPHPRPGA